MLSKKPLPNFLTIMLLTGSVAFAGQAFAEHHGEALSDIKEGIGEPAKDKDVMLKKDEVAPKTKVDLNNDSAEQKILDARKKLEAEAKTE